ncbi:L-seryl-tRNA(Sec) selenium transferase [Glaesserella parasuis]|uniref:L-seryl-tRNA(Sec) selenium transferase n=1 Tax=Glaesserella parasuis TaxID=738 RepID=UPI00094FC055|nr:L-seryl-tRNA(Sec) selenium transferase [Glaesserella parasuis]MDG6284647.1 L-seryl-tRNA(Sec) selenium transferase [Glaesserella parasuis]MDG6286768.1 L-seryl-tRNA(Sec) selenium transferase [Glaesserella parasuis]MDG6288943.1 L-seryl-tRNA(Sec) selenium transferase [Glaesserella parasuis]MDG6291035.1 L-seryl-tRNA(Sec) selenium transferase [Glaesserella parasuis]MDG6293094.1 L-seryl-tRNA(Sec) selenium transferase [Glaesserella parasuis]
MQSLFRSIPAIDKLLKTSQGADLIQQFGHQAFVAQARLLIEQARQHIQQHQSLPDFLQTEYTLFNELTHRLQSLAQVKMKPVFNLTGIVLHTNLGRGLWSEQAISAATSAMRNNVALEFDIEAGKRSHRDLYISELLQQLTGAEAACVVNNNAAAVLLMLATFAQGKEVIISRGELIEIGGAFRIPDIMAQAGCKLVEVGTTNRTHLKDYRNAINENTAFLMKVHTSNYQIQGFTSSVSEEELVALGQEFNLPVISDLGSGSLTDMQALNLPAEPMVQQKVASGVDLVSFSGDKLLGGPQAGIIVGKKALIDQLQQHPFKRVLRCDKVILSGLEATLRHYLFPDRLTDELPTLHLLTQSLDGLQQKAERLKEALYKRLDSHYILQIEPSEAQIGSGALPTEKIPSLAVTISADKQSDLLELEKQFQAYPNPIIARFAQQKMWLDVRSVAEFEVLIFMLEEL